MVFWKLFSWMLPSSVLLAEAQWKLVHQSSRTKTCVQIGQCSIGYISPDGLANTWLTDRQFWASGTGPRPSREKWVQGCPEKYLSHCSNLERSDLFGRLQKPPYEEVHILHLVINCLQPWNNVLRENLCKHFPWRHWGQTTQLPPAETWGVFENPTKMWMLKPGVWC